MANGKIGDHPYTDIVSHGIDVYSQEVATLVRAIARLADEGTKRQLADLLVTKFNDSLEPDISKLKELLATTYDRLARDARERGHEDV